MTRALERSAVIALPGRLGESGQALEGLHGPVPDPVAAAVIAPPHPLMGGSMESPVLTEIAWACDRASVASLRFNWRGVGGSSGQASGEESVADQDFSAALAFMEESHPGPLVACGYSFGALAALRASLTRSDIERLVLVAPPTSMLSQEALSSFRGKLFIAAGEDDQWVDSAQLLEQLEETPSGHLELIANCDHFFMNELGVLGRRIAAWWGVDSAETD